MAPPVGPMEVQIAVTWADALATNSNEKTAAAKTHRRSRIMDIPSRKLRLSQSQTFLPAIVNRELDLVPAHSQLSDRSRPCSVMRLASAVRPTTHECPY